MQRFHAVLLQIWREVSRHLEISESLERLFPILTPEAPLGRIVLRELDLERSAIDTLASAAKGRTSDASQRTRLAAGDLRAILEWGRAGVVLHQRAAKLAARLPHLLPDGVAGDVLAVPLDDENGPVGVALLCARGGCTFDGSHERLAEALREPLAVAVANERRLREIERLREAALADRDSLLSRLGRSDLGETIVGASAGLRPVMERVERVAHLDVPVLILGETGSGKEVIARAIHGRSRRQDSAFLRVNCGAIAPGLIDSELFGHERGSFTGATGERRGWFERAHGGTLFLDEIGELPPEAQVRLLRVLQDGTLERVGGHRSIRVDVRIVAATHRDLRAMIDEGRFREDLWYRIAVFPVHLPALRDHLEDVPALASHFALRAAKRFGMPARLPTHDDLDLLVRYPWPGNVRELGAVMERAVILSDGRRLDVARALGPIPDSPGGAGPEAEAPAPPLRSPNAEPSMPGTRTSDVPPARADDLPRLDAAMARHIQEALTRTLGRIEGPYGAAALLGINPNTLRGRMRRLGIVWRDYRPRGAR